MNVVAHPYTLVRHIKLTRLPRRASERVRWRTEAYQRRPPLNESYRDALIFCFMELPKRADPR